MGMLPMLNHALVRRCVAACLLLLAGSAWAGDPCPALAQQQTDPQVATRIAAIACAENLRWKQPFIDSQGRLASASTYEAESSGLADGTSPWRRVAYYWQSSGLLRTGLSQINAVQPAQTSTAGLAASALPSTIAAQQSALPDAYQTANVAKTATPNVTNASVAALPGAVLFDRAHSVWACQKL